MQRWMGSTNGLFSYFFCDGCRPALAIVHLTSTMVTSTLSFFLRMFLALTKIEWSKWKDQLSKKMTSEGGVTGLDLFLRKDIWECLDAHRIDSCHLVAWKPLTDTLYKISLYDQPHPSR